MNKRIIIVGGGFAGVECASKLVKRMPRGAAEIVLFNSENHLVFSPLLAEVVGSSINPLDVVVPLRQLLPRVFCRTEEVQMVYPASNEVEYLSEYGQAARMTYDHLVIACGNTTNLNLVPGMSDHGLALKTIGDAASLRSHIMQQMERAEVCSNPDRRGWYLKFIVVGGGFSGVEVAGEINDLVRDTAKYFRGFTEKDVNVTLIHSRDQILPEISSGLRDFAAAKMKRAGVTLVLNARVVVATPEGVGLQDGQFLKGATIVCTIGNASAPVIERLGVPKDKGRVTTQADMRVTGSENIWAIGDCSMTLNTYDGQPSPTTGQFAERQGKQCAQNIIRVMKGEPTRPFAFKQLGELCSIGGHSAVADLFGLHLSGFLAWFVWRGIYLFKLPTWARRVQVGFDWAWLLLFPRDLAHLRTRPTDRVSHAYYKAGDFIIRRDDPATNLYIIERGEVEVIRATPKDPGGETIAVLGPGSFFGEKALLSDAPRVASVRARTPVELLVMGKNIFNQVSSALGSFRDALGQALNRRTIDVWKGRPQAHDLMSRTLLKEVLEPVPRPLLTPATTFQEVSQAFVEHSNEFFYVCGEGETLEGVVMMTDLFRARDASAAATTPVSEFMSKNPVALAADDSCAVAVEAMREYRLKSLPIVEKKENRKLVGCVRIRRLMGFVLKHTLAGKASNSSPEQK
ncbi:MAG TPA: FAD-dependent oxidoreductase [Methylomirabilota bacterium]|nr:FAD-dependent oxidoreductase [Methylomirabilota bacterium]